MMMIIMIMLHDEVGDDCNDDDDYFELGEGGKFAELGCMGALRLRLCSHTANG